MSRSVNQVVLLGRLTRDPELRQTPNGASVASFSLALNRSWKDQKSGEWQEETDFIDCVAWGPLAERLERMVKRGQRLLVTGRLSQRSWEQDGQKRNKIEVVISDMTLIEASGEGSEGGFDDGGSSSSNSSSSKSEDVVVEEVGSEEIDLDSIPF
jgi:single-strand DNA-binding protein